MCKTTLRDARVLVTGSEGFLGKHLVHRLGCVENASIFTLPHSADPGEGCDLTMPDQAETVIENCTRDGRLDFVFHLAGFNGGIEFNRRFPADIFYTNTLMGLNLLEACAGRDVGKIVCIVASCAYGNTRKARSGMLSENEFFEGEPDATVAGHGFAKRNVQAACRFYRNQYDLHAVCVCPTTLYGPHDNFDPARTKVVGAMVQRFVEARRKGETLVEVWGTGRPLREFLHARDCASLLIGAALKYDDSDLPLNLGTGQEISIADLAILVATEAGYTGSILFNHDRPDGQYRKRLDLTRMQKVLGELPEFTPLEQGIRETVRWYEETHP